MSLQNSTTKMTPEEQRISEAREVGAPTREIIKAVIEVIKGGMEEETATLRKRAAQLQKEARGLIKSADTLEIMGKLLFGEKEVPADAQEGGVS